MIRIGYSAVMIALALSSGYFSMNFAKQFRKPQTAIQYGKPINELYSGVFIHCDASDIKPDLAGSEMALLYAANCSWKGDYKKADHFYKMALNVRMKELGPADHQTLVANMSYFNDLIRQSRFVEAEKLAREGMEAVKVIPGELWFIGTADRVSDALLKQEKYSKALELQKEILSFEEKNCPLECRQTKEKIESIRVLMNREN